MKPRCGVAEHDISRFYGKIACGQLQGPDTKRGERLERQRLVLMGHTFLGQLCRFHLVKLWLLGTAVLI